MRVIGSVMVSADSRGGGSRCDFQIRGGGRIRDFRLSLSWVVAKFEGGGSRWSFSKFEGG